MSTQETEKLNAIDVEAVDVSQETMNPKNYEMGDRLVYLERNEATPGTVTDITLLHKAIILEITPFNSAKEKINVRASDVQNLSSLFYIKDDKKINREFGYEELTNLFNKDSQGNNQILNLDWKDIQNNRYDHMALMSGKRTSLIKNVQSTVQNNEGKNFKITIDAKLQLKRRKSGKVYVSYEKKFQRLDLDKGVYGQKFTDAQKKQLEETNELGLIEYSNPQTGLVSDIWVSVDPELNQVVTLSEKQVDITRIYNVKTTKEQQETLKRGEHIFVDFKKDNEKVSLFAKISASASSRDGKIIMSKDSAIANKMIPEKKKTESKSVALKR